MAAVDSAPVRRGLFRIGAADIVFLVFALAILQRASGGMVDDPGLGWQLRIPDAMAEQGGFLYSDPFGNVTNGQPWTPWGFLGSALLRFADGWGGLDGLAMLTALTVAFLLRCLYRMLGADGVPAVQAIAWTFLAALGISSGWVARPNVFTLLFMLATVRVCVQWHREKIARAKTLWLVPLFVVWANTHGGFAAGLATVAVSGLAELVIAAIDRDRREGAIARFRWFAILGVACALGTLVNPYGPRLHLQVLQLLGDSYFMNLNDDWLSPDFHATGAFRLELLILLLPLLLATSRCRPDAVSLALCIVWLHFALNGRRYCPIWVLVTVPTLAKLAAGLPAIERAGKWFTEAHPDFTIPPPSSADRSPWLWTAVIALAMFGSTRYVGGYARHHPDNVPVKTLDHLLEIHRSEKVFHSINWGGYLTWHGWLKDPRFLVWIDDRNEVHSRERIEEWRTITAAQPGWREKLNDLDIGLVCVERDCGLAYRLAEEPGWERIDTSDQAVIFRRVSIRSLELDAESRNQKLERGLKGD